ncbi:MAG: hypothetical protein AAGD25_09080 [Cyanobacteria bacterium P01_F01_bin.150]
MDAIATKQAEQGPDKGMEERSLTCSPPFSVTTMAIYDDNGDRFPILIHLTTLVSSISSVTGIIMSNLAIDYLTDSDGNPKAVVIPIELWRKLLPQSTDSLKDLPENLEDYCLSKAMDEAIDSPVLSKKDAFGSAMPSANAFLEQEDID